MHVQGRLPPPLYTLTESSGSCERAAVAGDTQDPGGPLALVPKSCELGKPRGVMADVVIHTGSNVGLWAVHKSVSARTGIKYNKDQHTRRHLVVECCIPRLAMVVKLRKSP